MDLGNLTEEQQQALSALLANVPKGGDPGSSGEQEASPQQPLTFTWGSQSYTARDQADLQAKLAEIQQQEVAAREQERLRSEAAVRAASAPKAPPPQAPAIDKEQYANLFLTDPLKAQQYLWQNDPVQQSVLAQFAQELNELKTNQAVSNFVATTDYEPNDANWAAMQQVMGQMSLPFTFNGLQAGYAFAKASGLIKAEAGAPEFQPQQRQEQGFLPPPPIPRGSSPSQAADESEVMDRFESLSADKMKDFLMKLSR